MPHTRVCEAQIFELRLPNSGSGSRTFGAMEPVEFGSRTIGAAELRLRVQWEQQCCRPGFEWGTFLWSVDGDPGALGAANSASPSHWGRVWPGVSC